MCTHSFPSRKRKADGGELTALKRPKLARRRRNGGKKENLEQLYLVSGSFPDQTHTGDLSSNNTKVSLVPRLPYSGK